MRDRLITFAVVIGIIAALVWWNGRAQEEAEVRATPRVESWSLRSFPNASELAEKNKGAKAVVTVGIDDETVGDVTIELYPDVAPITVENFVELAEAGFYNGLTFHRLVPGLVVQGGDKEGTGKGSPGWRIVDEFNSKNHVKGAVGMARTEAPNSAGSQFYICLADVPMWDGHYTIFGQVIDGMDHIERLAAVGAGLHDRPHKNLIIESVRIVRPEPPSTTPEADE